MLNISFTIQLPAPGEMERVELEELLQREVVQAIAGLRSLLTQYKKAGCRIPSITVKGSKREDRPRDTEIRAYMNKLSEHQGKTQPNHEPAKYMRAITGLYEMGYSAEESIAIFEECRAVYPAATWLTVWRNIMAPPKPAVIVQATPAASSSRPTVEPAVEPDIVPLSREARQALVERIRRGSKDKKD